MGVSQDDVLGRKHFRGLGNGTSQSLPIVAAANSSSIDLVNGETDYTDRELKINTTIHVLDFLSKCESKE